MDELISRQAAIDALDEQIAQCNKALKSFVLSFSDAKDLKMWRGTGCRIHPRTVEKAKQRSLEKAVLEGDAE